MKKKLMVFTVSILCFIGHSFAQTNSWAKVIIPPGQQFDKSEEHQLQIMLSGMPYSVQDIKGHISNIYSIPGVNYFNIIIQPDAVEGYCDLRFSVSSKEDFSRMLKNIFCQLQLKNYIVNEISFETCDQVIIP